MTRTDPTPRRPALALLLLSVAQFLVVLDFSIVNVALPDIGRDLGFSTTGLQWVVSAYALAFGGFLLVGGRAADLFGRRRVFVAGLAAFGVASLAGGLAGSQTGLVAARAAQGLASAAIAPAAMSFIAVLFAEGPARNRALGALAAVGSAGVAAGVVLGGVLTEAFGWRAVMVVNVPVAAAAVVAAGRLLPASRSQTATALDLGGAVTVTGGLLALVFALTQAESAGWASAQTLVLLAAAAALLAAFVAVERRSAAPLVPLGIFRHRALAGANAAMLLAAAAFASMFLFLSVYLQQVLGLPALATGLAFLPMAVVLLAASGWLAGRLVPRFGIRRLLVPALATMAVGLAGLTQVSSDGSYVADVLPWMLLVAAGMGISFTPAIIAATSGVADAEQGLAAGLVNTGQQVGAALGVAILAAVAAAAGPGAEAAAPDAAASAAALNTGLQAAFAAGAVLAALASLVAWILVPRDRPAPAAPAAPVPPARPADRVDAAPVPVGAA